ncbi:hypothetical protein HG535_0B01990 [Zygotorulaspora mrakii]|uniref:rRNA biogenesis protein RRP36 n=1 Tax=Zygotorulaspora mrakii TaxID=42260 RepID=A0A7H9AXY6_ZYGMR|nr:uncharacterized protein HG535_0B01990 [Zygotorulaspora mrakii]QLG71161.1 hypothetical protein HG535_0B01990 [Zygotorulaspora mrakii]
MSYFFKSIQPGYESASDEEHFEEIIKRRASKVDNNANDSSDDELKTLTFGSLKKADTMLLESEKDERKKSIPQKDYKEKSFEPNSEESESESNSDEGDFFEDDQIRNSSSKRSTKKGKHAPKEHSSKKRVPKIRDIPGLDIPKNRNSNLYQDIRFDKSTGEPQNDVATRKNYKFLDEYRSKEIKELESLLKDKKFLSKVSTFEVQEMNEQLKSMKSKLQTLQNKELERQIIQDYERDINKDNKNKFHLKKNDRRKVIQKWKFDHMKSQQREKVMERKRKKRLGKEFKQFEFHKTR